METALQTIDDWATEAETYILSHLPQTPIEEFPQEKKYSFTKPSPQLSIDNTILEKKISELSNKDIVKILITRSETDPNIYMLNDIGKLFMQIHHDRMTHKRQNSDKKPYPNNNNPKQKRDNRNFPQGASQNNSQQPLYRRPINPNKMPNSKNKAND